MNELIKVTGKQKIGSIEFTGIEGGFGEGKKAMLVKDIAEIHNQPQGEINRRINDNRVRFKSGVDIIDLKSVMGLSHNEYGFTQNAWNRLQNAYILSERGYSKLLKILEDDKAWEIYDDLVDNYFEMRQARDFSPTANRELRLYNLTMKVSRLELLKAQINLELLNMANATEKEIAKYLSSVTLAEYERQSGILGQTLDNNVDHIKNIVNASYLNATFSERIWQNLDELRSTLTTTIKKSILQGKNPKTFASDLMKRFDVSRANAESILLTETARIQAEVQTDSFIRAGYERYEYLAETGACHKCAALDGKIFKLSEASYGVNLYPMHPHCRCSTVPDYEKK